MHTLPQSATTEQAFYAHVRAAAAKAIVHLPAAGERIDKAMALVLADAVELDGPGRYAVASATSHMEKWYMVTGNACDCPDYTHRSADDPNMVCKHIIATWLYRRAIEALEKEEILSVPDNTCTITLDADGVPCHAVYAQCPGHQEPQATPEPTAQAAAPVVPSLPEAAASINAFIMVAGHRCQITLRDNDEERLMQRMTKLLAYYTPAPGK